MRRGSFGPNGYCICLLAFLCVGGWELRAASVRCVTPTPRAHFISQQPCEVVCSERLCLSQGYCQFSFVSEGQPGGSEIWPWLQALRWLSCREMPSRRALSLSNCNFSESSRLRGAGRGRRGCVCVTLAPSSRLGIPSLRIFQTFWEAGEKSQHETKEPPSPFLPPSSGPLEAHTVTHSASQPAQRAH